MASTNHHSNESKRKRGSYVDFLCGWSAGCIETVLLYPQNKLIFRQQLYGIIVTDAVKQVSRKSCIDNGFLRNLSLYIQRVLN